MNEYVIGLDFGTDSVRAVLIITKNGNELASEVHWYQRWKNGQYCNASINQFRQHPLDHIEGLEHTIKTVVTNSYVDPKTIKGICIDTTGSSPIPVTEDGTPLAFTKGFEENPNAMMVLWKDHTAIDEANEINELATNWGGEDFTKYEGGIYSSEWFWAKILHIIREDNRGPGEMSVWLAYDLEYTRPGPAPTLEYTSNVTASVKSKAIIGVNDQLLPEHSNDHSLPYLHCWPKKGTQEWVQFDFETTKEVSKIQTYWFDDGPHGGCRIPAGWIVEYKDGETWKAVEVEGDYTLSKDPWDSVQFKPVATDALRIVIDLPKDYTAGLYEVIIE
jgi:hypothetical protein